MGIPNVGKSTFINAFAGKACTKTGNKPGVTKGKQWIRINKNLELLDTPGILWPKFEDQQVGARLAMVGSIKDEILNLEELSLELLGNLHRDYPGLVEKRYDIQESETPLSMLEQIADNRKCIQKGGQRDYVKAANISWKNSGMERSAGSPWSGRRHRSSKDEKYTGNQRRV